MDSPIFRCPFEVQGDAERSVIEVALGDDRGERLSALTRALAHFYRDTTRTAIRFVLPQSLRAACSSNEQLKPVILPYQAEFIAADVHARLAPFLPYQGRWRERVRHMLRGAKREERMAARALSRALRKLGLKPRSVVELAGVFQELFEIQIAMRGGNPVLTFGNLHTDGRDYWLFRADPSAFATYKPQHRLADPAVNNALFTIVKTPFYPPSFGRWSTEIELIVTRDVDVQMLPPDTKRHIRRRANEVHRAHGVRIEDVDETQQPTGLWIPGEKFVLRT